MVNLIDELLNIVETNIRTMFVHVVKASNLVDPSILDLTVDLLYQYTRVQRSDGTESEKLRVHFKKCFIEVLQTNTTLDNMLSLLMNVFNPVNLSQAV